MRLALAQINSVVGDIDGNAARVVDWLERGARRAGRPRPVSGARGHRAIRRKICCSAPGSCAPPSERSTRSRDAAHGITVLVGAPHLDADLYNACFVLADGEVRAVYRKRYLPNYGVFDEDRYFAPGDDLLLLRFGEASSSA